MITHTHTHTPPLGAGLQLEHCLVCTEAQGQYQHQVEVQTTRTNKDHLTLNNSPRVLTVTSVTVLWACVQASLPQGYKGKGNGDLHLKWLLSIGTLYLYQGQQQTKPFRITGGHGGSSQPGLHRKFQGWGRGGERKSKGEKKREQREGGRENMTHPPFKYT